MSKGQTTSARRRREEAVDWLLRNRDPEQSVRSAAEFDAWCLRDPANKTAYDEAARLLGEARSAILSDSQLAASDPVPGRRGTRAFVGMVAVIGAAIGLFIVLDGPMRLRADRIAGTGETPLIYLADGSTVQLNATAAVAFDLDGARRVVRLLRGEAYFQVAKDRQRPFVVEAMGIETTALGTAFNVRLRDDTANVVVTEHRVRISGPSGSTNVEVDAGQGAAYTADGRIGPPEPREIDAALAWRRGQLVVDNAPLQTVVDEIGRHFHGRIVLTPDAAGRRVSGTFTISDPDTAFSVLENSLGVRVRRIGPVVFVSG